MIGDNLFCHLSSLDIARLVDEANESVCFAAPGIQLGPANAVVRAAARLEKEMVTVCLDTSEQVFRMGYGDLEAVKLLHNNDVAIHSSPQLRNGLVICDGAGYTYTPTALLLEKDVESNVACNAMALSEDQVKEIMPRLSAAARVIARLQAHSEEEKQHIDELPVEVSSTPVKSEEIEELTVAINAAPIVPFDLERQVRVFTPLLQYLEISLTGASIQRKTLRIPDYLMRFGDAKDLDGRLSSSFDLIEGSSDLSSKSLDKELKAIRDNFTKTLPNGTGRVFLKGSKDLLETRIKELEEKLESYKEKVEAKLDEQLLNSREKLVEYYLPIVLRTPPDAILAQLGGDELREENARRWLDTTMEGVFPKAAALVKEMKLDHVFKDLTIESLDDRSFIDAIKHAFPSKNWDKLYSEFLAVGEREE